MAELLIMKADKVHDDPTISANHCYKRGDIVQVVPDGYSWGRKEHPSTGTKFLLLKISGPSVSDANKFMDEDGDSKAQDLRLRRKWCVLMDTIPEAVRTSLDDTGEASTAFADIRDFIENKVTNETA